MIDGEASCMPTGVKVRKTLKWHPNVQIITAGGFVWETFLLNIQGTVQSQNGLKLDRHEPQSKELVKRAPRVSSALSFVGGVYIGAVALHALNWWGLAKISRLSQWVGSSFKWFLPVFATRRGRGEGICAVWHEPWHEPLLLHVHRNISYFIYLLAIKNHSVQII